MTGFPADVSDAALLEIELEVGRRAAGTAIAQIATASLFYFSLIFRRGRPLLETMCVAGICVAMLSRFWLMRIQRVHYPEPVWRRRWVRLFRAAAAMLGLCWGLLTASTLEIGGITYPFFIAALIIAGTATISVQAFGLDLALTRIFQPLILGPTLFVALVHSPQRGYPALAGIFGIFLFYLLTLAQRAHDLFWETVRNRELALARQQQLTVVLDSIPGIVFWTDADGRYLGINARAAAAMAMPPEEIVGSPLGFRNGGADLAPSFYSFLGSSDVEKLVELRVTVGDETRWALVAMKKYETAAGPQVLGIALDIEDRKRMEQELEKTRAAAIESARLAELGVLSSGIAHEINNPLQIIRFAAGMIRRHTQSEPPMPEAQRLRFDKIANKIDGTIARIDRIIVGLRELSRKEADDPYETVAVESVIRDVVDLSVSRTSKSHVRVSVGPVPDGACVECRRGQIGQILLNLLNNSYDAVSDSEAPWIHVGVRDLGQHVEIDVVDSGPGVAENIRDKVMLPFFTTKEVGKGTGLGLSVSRSIVESHGGRLFIDESSANTHFVVQLPKQHGNSVNARTA